MPNETVKEDEQLIEVFGMRVDFVSGPVERVYSLGEYTIVAFSAQDGSTTFRAYVKTEMVDTDFPTLETALVGAVAFKYDGPDSKAPMYFMRMVGAHIPVVVL